MDTFTLHLITPEATFFSGDAMLVEAPGTLGEFGVLAGHMNFISTLKPGVVRIYNHNDQKNSVFVAGGIAEVNATSCTILAERLVDLSTLSHSDAQMRLATARATLDNTFDDVALADAHKEMEIAEAIVNALA